MIKEFRRMFAKGRKDVNHLDDARRQCEENFPYYRAFDCFLLVFYSINTKSFFINCRTSSSLFIGIDQCCFLVLLSIGISDT